jgi:hypothetical protein
MNPYSGIFDLLEAKGMLKKQGNRYAYTTSEGEEMLEYRKAWTGEKLDIVMTDFARKEAEVVNTAEVDEEATVEEQVEE